MTLRDRLLDVRHVMRARELLIYVIGMLFYLAVLSFISFGKKFFDHKWPGCRHVSGAYVGLPYYISAGVSTPFGIAVDRYGRSMLWVTVPCVCLTAIHAWLLAAPAGSADACPSTPLGAMIWLGLSYSCCAAAIWPMLALVVAPERLNTGYGLMSSAQNAVFAFVPSIIGSVLQAHSKTAAMQTKGFDAMEWAFVGMSGTASVLCVVLIAVDARKDGVLMASAKQLQEGTKKKDATLDNFAAGAEEPLLLDDGVMWGE